MDDIWSDPAVEAAAATREYVKFTSVGDSVVGTITSIGKHLWKDGSVAVKFTFAEDDVPELTASQKLLLAALLELQPKPGERMKVELVAIDTNEGRTLKRWRVAVVAPDGVSRSVDQSS